MNPANDNRHDSSNAPSELSGIKSCAYAVTFSPDGQMIAASGAGDGVVALWHIGTGER